MRAVTDIDAVLMLAAHGHSASEIARRTEIPRSTVRDWLRGALPRDSASARRSPAGTCARCGGRGHDPSALPAADYLYLLGLYLGDGCISAHPRGVFKLRFFLDARYPGIIKACAGALGAVTPANRIGRRTRSGGYPNSHVGSNVELWAYSRSWPCLLPQHGPGRKHQRRIVLSGWQRELVAKSPEALLRGLVHSDGSRFINTGRKWRHPRYAFSNASADIRGIFCDACDVLGLRWTIAPRTVYVSRKADVARLDDVIGPKA